ncbi:MAG TPA: SRPBCC domain-containing protein [Myxococcales bacterium]|nr:SRPBCC domain-containing protein [Myxococcales bacterium]
MKTRSLTHTVTVNQTPEAAFAAINDVRGWWSGDVEGKTDEVGAEFTYRYQDIHYSKQRITELVPGKRVAWLVLDSYLQFIEDKKEWNGTRVIFEIAPKAGKTEIRFTHQGLSSEHECFTACSDAWGFLVKESLKNLIEKGAGQPFRKERKASRRPPVRAAAR